MIIYCVRFKVRLTVSVNVAVFVTKKWLNTSGFI